jgi:hypothetical protein
MIGKKMDLKTVNEYWASTSLSALTRLARVFEKSDSKIAKTVTVGFAELAPLLIRDMLICLDDFERLNQIALSHEVLLGFISGLKETARCKVAIILNDAQLPPENNQFEKYREKVVDVEYNFSPRPADVLQWGLPSTIPQYELIRELAAKLNITNVRILKRIAGLSELMWPILKDLHPNVCQTAYSSLVLLSWCYFDKSGTAPDIEFVRKRNSIFSSLAEAKKKTEVTSLQSGWIKLLENYRFVIYDEFDETILKVIREGYVEETGFVEWARKRSENDKGDDLESQFANAWALFRDSFDDNRAEVIAALDASFRIAVFRISPSNLNGLVLLLRELEAGELADELIAFYVSSRRSESELFDLENYPFSSDVNDKSVVDAFENQMKGTVEPVTLEEAVRTIAKRKGWAQREFETLNNATPDQLYRLFKGNLAGTPSRIVPACLQFNDPPNAKLYERVFDALRRLASESIINAVRVRRLGVDLDSPSESD